MKTWIAAFLLAAALGWAVEGFWRGRGHEPSVVDDADLWSQERARASRGGGDAVVLLGASRMKMAFDPEVFRDAHPERALVQLAVIGGTSPVAPLLDLGKDEHFRGLVICSMAADWLIAGAAGEQQADVSYYHEAWRAERALSRLVRTELQERLVLIRPELSLRSVALYGLTNPGFLRPHYVVTRSNRCAEANFEMLKAARGEIPKRELLAGAGIDRAEWPGHREAIREAIEAIEARGGAVVFVRLPMTNAYWRATEERFPRSEYWDDLGGIFGVETIHFQDVAVMRALECPDNSHIDRRDRSAFTRSLLAELRDRGFLQSPE